MYFHSKRTDARPTHPPNRPQFNSLLLCVSLCLLSDFGSSQTPGIVCSNGIGHFEVKFSTDVKVTVGAARTGKLANRGCGAALSWEKQDLQIAENAADVDIDVLGADIGLGTPVVAFQVRKPVVNSPVEYQIYSLHKPPRLLRTIVAKDFLSAADTDLDGRIEIWAADASAVDGFEGLPLEAFDFVPSAVLRFEKSGLLDVSWEFRSYFDDRIGRVRALLGAQEFREFKDSDGKLAVGSNLSLEQILHLRNTKIKVLEIVWAYLYSGRDEEAWRELTSLWPAVDLDRIRAAILNARAQGIRAQVDGVESTLGLPPKKPTYIYSTPSDEEGPPTNLSPAAFKSDTRPQPILLRRAIPQNAELSLPQSEELVDLVIDAAGKVRLAQPEKKANPELITACSNWKFIPAFKDGRAVASRMRFAVSFRR
jgi:hypothetical protein